MVTKYSLSFSISKDNTELDGLSFNPFHCGRTRPPDNRDFYVI